MNDEKKFVKPIAEVLEFANDDIITKSLGLEDNATWGEGFGEDY